MFKNQLQELAQRSCFNLPSYACIREGPDHAPRFKASVNFNGEIFESPSYCNTLRQAEHAAAEVALNVLSSRGPSRSLTARVLDETGIYKNLLQETAHRAGLNLPTYTTIRSGPGHVPIFTSTVELAGMSFTGEPAKTKKQAEKNAAIAAWSAMKRMPNLDFLGIKGESHEEQDQAVVTRFLSNFKSKDDYTKQARKRDYQIHYNQSRKRMIKGHIRDTNSLASSSSSSSDHSSKIQPCKLLNQLLDSDGCSSSTQKQNSVSLLPPPPPRTVSKILPPTTSSRKHPFANPYPWNRSIQIQDKSKSQVEKIEIVRSSVLEEYLKEEEEWLGTKLDAFKGSKPIGKEADVFDSTSTTSSRPISIQSSTWRQVTSLLERSQNPYPISSNSAKLASLCPNLDRPMYTTGGFNFKPHGIAPAVQIRSVIPVCSAPPPPIRPQEASSSSARSGCISTTAAISNKSPVVNSIKVSEKSLASSTPADQLGSEFSNKLQV